ncbi:MAG: hypothetical protein ACYTFA_08645 [Planctomycetota bacterium]|jgi:hypothetical protein
MSYNRRKNFTRRVTTWIIALGSGGTLLSGCETRFKEAVVAGSKDYLGAILTSPDTANAVLDQLGFAQVEDED